MIIILAFLMTLVQNNNDEISQLIEQLSSNSIEAREKACVRLIEIGEPAFNAVKLATKNSDPEISIRANNIIKEITRNNKIKKIFIQSNPITLKKNDIKIQDLLSEISQISGINVTCNTEAIRNLKISIDVKNIPFMQVMDTVCYTLKDIGWYFDNDKNATLSYIDATPIRPSYYDGGFRLQLTSIGTIKQTNFNNSITAVLMYASTTLEPMLQIAQSKTYIIDSIVDDHDTTLTLKANTQEEGDLFNKIQYLSISISEGDKLYAIGIHHDAKTLKSINGRVKYSFPIDIVPVKFENLSKEAPVECGDFIASVCEPEYYSVGISIIRKSGEPIDLSKAIYKDTLVATNSEGSNLCVNINANKLYMYGDTIPKILKFNIVNEYWEKEFKFKLENVPLH